MQPVLIALVDPPIFWSAFRTSFQEGQLEEKAQQNADDINAERDQGEHDVASTPSKKKRGKKNKTEAEPEPKDINNTLGKNEGKGLF